jgi:hypothetical protein
MIGNSNMSKHIIFNLPVGTYFHLSSDDLSLAYAGYIVKKSEYQIEVKLFWKSQYSDIRLIHRDNVIALHGLKVMTEDETIKFKLSI